MAAHHVVRAVPPVVYAACGVNVCAFLSTAPELVELNLFHTTVAV